MPEDAVVGASELARHIQTFLVSGSGDFESLALAVFQYQFTYNLPYRRFCTGRGIDPDAVRSWREIPPAPAAAFKQFALTCVPLETCTPVHGGRTFHSSGTTGNETSKHYMDAPALDCYRTSLHNGFIRFVGKRELPLPVYALMPAPEDAPHSSLSFMAAELIATHGGRFYWGDTLFSDVAQCFRTLSEPAVVFGTAFAFVNFFDRVSETFALPPGSIVIETGGFKGRSREIPREELYRLFSERFGVPAQSCLAEYGMSEMASQFYSLADLPKQGPPWVRTRVIDPVTGDDAAPGTPGLLTHYDLANLNSVLAIQTEDMGVFADYGSTGFTLLGRAPGAVLRGCSLTAEEFAAAVSRK
ncbi:MAG: coenzyme F390 synthetase [Armatimonadaceae bacterium]